MVHKTFGDVTTLCNKSERPSPEMDFLGVSIASKCLSISHDTYILVYKPISGIV